MTLLPKPASQKPLRVAVITPYYREPLTMLRQCHDSVRTQTYPCTHFLIADGHPQEEIFHLVGGATPEAAAGAS